MINSLDELKAAFRDIILDELWEHWDELGPILMDEKFCAVQLNFWGSLGSRDCQRGEFPFHLVANRDPRDYSYDWLSSWTEVDNTFPVDLRMIFRKRIHALWRDVDRLVQDNRRTEMFVEDFRPTAHMMAEHLRKKGICPETEALPVEHTHEL